MFDTSSLNLPDLETKYKIHPGILNAIMNTESAGNPAAVSPRGARGLFQFMPETAQAYGVNPDDPHQSADGAARMIADLSKQFNGDVPHVLAAYNWGSGNLAKHGIEAAPPETQNYIKKVSAQLAPREGQIELNSPSVERTGTYADVQAPPAMDFSDLIPKNPQAQTDSRPAPQPPAGMDFSDLIPQKPALPPGAEPMPPIGANDRPSYRMPNAATSGPTATTRAARGVMVGAQGVGRGVADIAGLPVDLATLGLNTAEMVPNLFGAKLPPIENPVGGSDWIAKQAGNVMEGAADLTGGAPPISEAQMTPDERLGHNVSRFATAAAIPGAGLAKTAEVVPVSKFPTMADAWLEAYRANPDKALIGDVAAGAGTGVGHTVAQNLAPDNPLATFGADLIGGLGGAGTAHIAQGGAQGLKNIVNDVKSGNLFSNVDKSFPKDAKTGKGYNKKLLDEGARYLQGNAENINDAQGALASAKDFYEQNNLPMPNSSALSNDTGLIGVGQAARAADRKPFLAQDRAVKTAQSGLIENAVPQLPAEEKGLAQSFAQQQAGTMRAEAQKTAETAQQKLLSGQENLTAAKQLEADKIAPVAAARGTEGQASQQLDKTINEGALQPRTKAKNAAFDAIDPEGALQRDASPLIETARAIKAQVGKLSPESSGVPAEFMQKLEALAPEEAAAQTGLLDELGNPITRTENVGGSGTVSMKDMLDARKYLNTAAEKAQQSGNFDLAKNIRKLKGQINDEVDTLAAEKGPGSAEAAAGNKLYKEEYAPYFAEGYGRIFRDKIQKDPSGRTVLPASQTADFFLKSSDEAAKDLSRIAKISTNPQEAENAVGNYMKAQLSQIVKSDGTMEPATMKKWLDNNRSTLSNFPKVQQELDTAYKDVLNGRSKTNAWAQEVKKLAIEHKTAEGSIGATERRINDSVLSTLIGKNPENAAAAILADGDPVARVKETMGLIGKNAGAKKAFQRSVADHIYAKFTGNVTEQTANESFAAQQSRMESFMRKPGMQEALAAVYADTPEAMTALRTAQRMGRDVAKMNIQGLSNSATIERGQLLAKFLAPIELAARPVMGALRTGGFMRTLKMAADQIPGLNDTAELQKLIIRAEQDPEIALALYGRIIDKTPPIMRTKELSKLLRLGDVSRVSTGEQREKGNDMGGPDQRKPGGQVIDIYPSKK